MQTYKKLRLKYNVQFLDNPEWYKLKMKTYLMFIYRDSYFITGPQPLDIKVNYFNPRGH